MRRWGMWAWLIGMGCQGDGPGPTGSPGSPGYEICNGIDDDGDGRIDAEDPDLKERGFLDEDGDGWGSVSVRSCGEGTAEKGGDCDDQDPDIHPGAPERCNEIDDDCDHLIDLDDPSVADRAYVDFDGDGFGVGEGEDRCPNNKEAPVGGDCNDYDAGTYPGAEELCDGIADNDCDGVEDPQELDLDGDGDGICSDCDDDDPTRSSRFEEACDGIDTDCDDLVDEDDPSVNPFTCGPVCGTRSLDDLLERASLEKVVLNPCLLDDRTVGLCHPDDLDLADRGQRIHRVRWRSDVEHLREPMFLFLPPGPGGETTTILDWAALAGYRVMSIGYVNEIDIDETCNGQEDGCFSNLREESVYGRDVSPHVDISEPDSLITRFRVALEEMGRRDPAGWSRYLDEDGDIVWSNVVVSGWSEGAGNAAMLAKHFEVRGGIFYSGPKDRIYDPYPLPSSWIRGPQATDGCRLAGVYHIEEHFTSNPEGDVLRQSWQSIGVPYPEFFHTDSVDGFEHAILALTQNPDPKNCRPHAIPADNDCLDPELFDAYRLQLCSVADEGTCVLGGVDPKE